jgi:hypothetical protein
MTDETRFTVELLDQDNYGSWSMRMEFLLESRGLGGCIDGTAAVQGSEKDRKARALIGLYVKEHHLATVSECKTAKEAWEALAQLFKARTNARMLQLRKELGELKMAPTETLAKYFARAKTLYKDLNGAGHKVEEMDVVFSILAGLPSQYKTITDILVTSGTNVDLTFSNTFSKLLVKEVESNGDKTEEEAGAFVVRQHRDDRVCYCCGKKGHFIKNCRKFKVEQERNQKSLMGFAL